MNKRWTEEETRFLKDNINIFDDIKMTKELAAKFSRDFTVGGVRKYRQRLGIKKIGNRGFFKVITNGVL